MPAGQDETLFGEQTFIPLMLVQHKGMPAISAARGYASSTSIASCPWIVDSAPELKLIPPAAFREPAQAGVLGVADPVLDPGGRAMAGLQEAELPVAVAIAW